MGRRWPTVSWLWGVAALMLALASAASAQGADPALNRPYEQPDYDTWVQRFERPGREVYDQREQILAASGVQRGMDVADIGAGTGLFTLLFAERVGPDGIVYAVDISRPFVERIARRAQDEGLDNVRVVLNTQSETGLPPGSIDLAFLSDVYHHLEQPAAMLESIRRALRPGGSLVIVDFRREPGRSSAWVLGHVRAGKAQVIEEVQAAGFEQVATEDFLKDNYFVRFRRP